MLPLMASSIALGSGELFNKFNLRTVQVAGTPYSGRTAPVINSQVHAAPSSFGKMAIGRVAAR